MANLMSQPDGVPLKTKLHTFYRSPLFNAIILGLVSFTQPGIWSALAGLGAGGLATPFFVNAANVITFAIMIVLSPIFAIAGNRWSLKWCLRNTVVYAVRRSNLRNLGSHIFSTTALFCKSNKFQAAALWVSEAAIGVGYPEENKKGVYIAIWFGLNKIGTIIASSIELSLNLGNDQQGSISSETYLILIGLQCLGLPLALLISPINKLIRSDGTKPVIPERTTFAEGFRRFWRIMKRPELAALIPIFLTSQWAQTYEGNYLTTYFTVRSRALASFIITFLGLFVNIIFGWFLDYDRLSRATRARAGWIILVVAYTVTYIYNLVLEAEYGKANPSPVFDIETPGFARAVAVYCVFFIPYNAFAVWGYWILGCFDHKIENLTFSTAILRSGESLASTISYALGASKSVSLLKNLLVASVLFWAAIPTTTWSVWQVKEPKKIDEDSECVNDDPQVVNVGVKGSGI
ncbi:uncharacterized protein MYU51_007617 [Penicillium brevicompactum]